MSRPMNSVTHPERITETDLERAFMAMAAFPDIEEASGYLIEEHNIMVSPSSLRVWAKKYPERYERARAQAAQLREQGLAGDLLNVADFATKVELMVIQHTRELLEKGELQKPSTVARELADVAAKAIDKKLALEGRPSRVTVTRSVTEIFNQLEAMKVIEGNAVEENDES